MLEQGAVDPPVQSWGAADLHGYVPLAQRSALPRKDSLKAERKLEHMDSRVSLHSVISEELLTCRNQLQPPPGNLDLKTPPLSPAEWKRRVYQGAGRSRRPRRVWGLAV